MSSRKSSRGRKGAGLTYTLSKNGVACRANRDMEMVSKSMGGYSRSATTTHIIAWRRRPGSHADELSSVVC